MIVLQLMWASLAVGVVDTPSTMSGSEFDILRRLAAMEGSQYLALRREILDHHNSPWNVAEASGESWELGVAAFVVNARQQSGARFARWDAREPRLSAAGEWYSLACDSPDDELAFLLEKVWKPIDPLDRTRALNDLSDKLGKWSARAGDARMWRAIWEQCPVERLREMSLFFLAASGDPAVLGVVAAVLSNREDPQAERLQGRCVAGLWYSELPEAAELLLAEWDYLKQDRTLARNALGALASSPDSRARQAVYQMAMDLNNPEWMRYEAVVKCSIRSHTGDRAFVEKFLGEVESLKLKREVVMALGKFPLVDVRSALREVLRHTNDAQLASAAALALSQGYIKTDTIDPRQVAEDIALLEQVAERADLPGNTRGPILELIGSIKKQRDRDK